MRLHSTLLVLPLAALLALPVVARAADTPANGATKTTQTTNAQNPPAQPHQGHMMKNGAMQGGMMGEHAKAMNASEKPEAKEVTLTGEILDMACYLSHDAHGPDHAACAKRCAQNGQPMGLLTADGKVFLLTADHADGSAYDTAKTLAGEQVTLTGLTEMQGPIHGLEVHSVKALEKKS